MLTAFSFKIRRCCAGSKSCLFYPLKARSVYPSTQHARFALTVTRPLLSLSRRLVLSLLIYTFYTRVFSVVKKRQQFRNVFTETLSFCLLSISHLLKRRYYPFLPAERYPTIRLVLHEKKSSIPHFKYEKQALNLLCDVDLSCPTPHATISARRVSVPVRLDTCRACGIVCASLILSFAVEFTC